MKLTSWYAIGVGTLIILQWTLFFAIHAIPELQTAPWEIGAHITAEFVLAVTLLVGGVAAQRSIRWARKTLLIALGMAIYSEINSPGYFAQLGQWPLVVMFSFLLAGAVMSAILLLTEENKNENRIFHPDNHSAA
jgi:hypothetical protein